MTPAPDTSLPDAFAPFLRDLDELRPGDGETIDVHTHLGVDEDGRSLAPDALIGALDSAGVSRACAFPLCDPDRRPGYRRPNDRVLAAANASGGRLVPFCRVDPADGGAREVERCLGRGARGVKLHLRAESVALTGDALDAVLALADDARVPVLLHAGAGLPPVGQQLVALAWRHPRLVLILAHAGIADQAILGDGLADHPNVLFDTACFSPLDVVALLARVASGRVVFGSDPPYGNPLAGLHLALRAARAAGLDDVATADLIGGTVARVLAGEQLRPGPAPSGATTVALPAACARLQAYGGFAFGVGFGGAAERLSRVVDLALAVCRDPTPGEAAPALARAASALEAGRALLGVPATFPQALTLIQFAITVAATPFIPVATTSRS